MLPVEEPLGRTDRRFRIRSRLRRGNLLRLRWNDVDLKERSALLRGVKISKSRGNHRRSRWSFAARAQILKALPRSLDGRVFPITAKRFEVGLQSRTAQART